jgi:hypothetical protein
LFSRFKVRDRFEFPTTLDMYPYTAEGLAAQEQQSSGSAPQPQAAAAQQNATAAATPGTPESDRSAYLYDLKV